MIIRENWPLKQLNTFGVDVYTGAFARITDPGDLIQLKDTWHFTDEKIFILGGGSNTLFIRNFDGLVVHNSIKGISVCEEDSDTAVVKAGAGETWNDLVNFCVEKKLGGIENLTLIPGSVGAAPIQNIGAYGQELKDTFYSLDAFEFSSVNFRKFSKDECKFGYRNSIFKNEVKNKFIITAVELKLYKYHKLNLGYKGLREEVEKTGNKKPGISDVSSAVEKLRRSKLPDPAIIGNAGSFFKNPVINTTFYEQLKRKISELDGIIVEENKIKISAGLLIEKCGWKGKRKGDVGTFPNHALILINYGNATGEEIFNFALEIQKSVENNFGISLEFEVNCIN